MSDFTMHYRGKRYLVSKLAKNGSCVIELPDGTNLLVGNQWIDGGKSPASAIPVSKREAGKYKRHRAHNA